MATTTGRSSACARCSTRWGSGFLRTGGLGAGHAVKALNNFVAAASFAATSEALIVGARFGLRPEDVLAALNASTGASFNTQFTMELHVLRRRFGVGFAMRLMVKDIALARDLVDATDSVAPMCRLTEELWADALAAEGPDADFTAAIKHWRRRTATSCRSSNRRVTGRRPMSSRREPRPIRNPPTRSRR